MQSVVALDLIESKIICKKECSLKVFHFQNWLKIELFWEPQFYLNTFYRQTILFSRNTFSYLQEMNRVF